MEFFLPDGEKRIFPRTRLSISCELTLADAQTTLPGQCLDLSTTGARITLDEAVSSGTRAHFRLKEHLGKEPFEAVVEVTRIDEIATDNTEPQTADRKKPTRYSAGLKIVEIL